MTLFLMDMTKVAIWAVVAAACVVVGINDLVRRRRKADVLATGRLVKGWYVMANNGLYAAGNSNLPALVVFSFDERANQHPSFLGEIAQDLYRLKNSSPKNETEATIVHFVRNERYVADRRRLIPSELTQGVDVYCADVEVYRDYLPGKVLREPFSYFKALPDGKCTGAYMVSAPIAVN